MILCAAFWFWIIFLNPFPKAAFTHGITFGGHPVSCAVGMRNLQIFDDEDILSNVRRNEAGFRERIESLRDIPIVGDVRGAGYFLALELVPDQQSDKHFTREQGENLLRGFLSNRLLEAGLVCRTDDRGDPVIQLSPPLVAGEAEFDLIESILRTCLSEASDRLN